MHTLTQKQCSKCLAEQPLEAFSPDARQADGLQQQCKGCRAEKARAYREANREAIRLRFNNWRAANRDRYNARVNASNARNRERVRANQRAWHAANPGKVIGYKRKRRYGLTQADFDALVSAQSNRCAICSEEFARTPHVDHDHVTGAVRGLLCSGCNGGLGYIEREGFLSAALAYLHRHGLQAAA